jgi:hypothetical protein
VKRSLVKHLPTKRPRALTRYVGKQHHHACPACRTRHCCSCQTPDEPRRCNQCVSGIPSYWNNVVKPKPCCTRSRLLRTADELDRYKLVGGPWFVCDTCALQFSFQPTKEDIT